MKSFSQTTPFSKDVARRLAGGETLHPRHRDHPLRGEWKGSWDCHVEPDWVLIYTIPCNVRPGR